MSTKTKNKAAPRSVRPVADTVAGPDTWTAPPSTLDEHLVRIHVLGQRVGEHIQFIGAVSELSGTSTEAKHNAVSRFYARLLVLEHELDRIQEDLKLG